MRPNGMPIVVIMSKIEYNFLKFLPQEFWGRYTQNLRKLKKAPPGLYYTLTNYFMVIRFLTFSSHKPCRTGRAYNFSL